MKVEIVAYFLLVSAFASTLTIAILKAVDRRPEGYEPPVGSESEQTKGCEVEIVAYCLISVALLAALGILGSKNSTKPERGPISTECGKFDQTGCEVGLKLVQNLEMKLFELENELNSEQRRTADNLKNTKEIETNLTRALDLVDKLQNKVKIYKKQAQEAEQLAKSNVSKLERLQHKFHQEENLDWVDRASLIGWSFDYSPVQTGRGKVWFLLSDRMMTWEEGKKFCEDKGLKMARIYNTQENEALFSMKQRLKSHIYLGGSKPESGTGNREQLMKMYTWWNGDKVENIGWRRSEPNNCGGRERYLAMLFGDRGASESWNDQGWTNSGTAYIACEYRIDRKTEGLGWLDRASLVDWSLQTPPVQTSKHGKVWYVLSDRRMTWEEGKKFCEEKGLKMARIYNSQENEALFAMKKRLKAPFYVGGSIPESTCKNRNELMAMYTWWNGDKVENLGWHGGEPNNCGRGERYLAIYFDHQASDSWNDMGWTNSGAAHIACEYRIGYD